MPPSTPEHLPRETITLGWRSSNVLFFELILKTHTHTNILSIISIPLSKWTSNTNLAYICIVLNHITSGLLYAINISSFKPWVNRYLKLPSSRENQKVGSSE